MKKILLVLSAFVLTSAMYAQNTSFEAEEGYELGEINGQNDWEVFSFLSESFTVTDEMASDGDYSLRLGLDSFIPDGTTAGATRDISQDVPDSPESYKLSADVYISSSEAGEIDFNVYGAGGSDALAGATIALLDGRVLIVELSDFSVGADLEVPEETFMHLSMLLDFENQETLYYVNDDLVYTGDLNLTEVTEYGFLTTGKAVGYVDNISTEANPTLNISEMDKNDFSHYTNQNRLYLKSSSEMKSVVIYHLNGQEVVSKSLNSTDEVLQIENLSPGLYLTRLEFEDHFKSFKFLHKN
ncbi:MAG: T9SS type A sorting domain-containing protein [Flavobacteriaceae bacterium]|nr:T9SS type A sorting domain-containing protein [Psychroflexus sp.]